MSFDLFVQRFENGDAAAMDGIAFRAVWGPYVDRTEPEFDLWHVHVDDGGVAEIYGGVADESFPSLMISRFSRGCVLDLLVEFAALADAVVLPQGCPTLLVREDQRRHLPEELGADAVIVRGGADVERIFDGQ
ncbi:hypothetical protein COUCH_15375 [Couchioplanes caeruleus]|uniref:hypothetical protein n=1 Tax=Couchioplanes caeruleus TaxID=56438 RepID=UPI0020BDF6AE|nr:hypothetical protein [Couchioplanes caeruleus]UQU67563.1 hypothetical protein COUCH_15375 [Couchioplanes caeruleus]